MIEIPFLAKMKYVQKGGLHVTLFQMSSVTFIKCFKFRKLLIIE